MCWVFYHRPPAGPALPQGHWLAHRSGPRFPEATKTEPDLLLGFSLRAGNPQHWSTSGRQDEWGGLKGDSVWEEEKASYCLLKSGPAAMGLERSLLSLQAEEMLSIGPQAPKQTVPLVRRDLKLQLNCT